MKDRKEAGQKLAAALSKYKNAKDTVVLGLARGGVVVAAMVAKALSLPLDVIVPRKIGAPNNPEFAIGAIAGDVVISDETIDPKLIERERQEAQRREKMYGQRAPLKGKTVILVDDGIATGSTMRASIAAVKKAGAKKIVVAVPVAPPGMELDADEFLCLMTPASFMAVGQFYESFPQVSDEEVMQLLKI